MKVNLQFSGTAAEMAEAFGGMDIDIQKLVKLLVDNNLAEKLEEVDDQGVYNALVGLAWDTVYLMHLIIENAGTQSKDYGVYLTQEQIENFDIVERSASSRVGGATRVCKRLKIDDILFLRKRKSNGEKRYYVSSGAIPTLRQYLEVNAVEYAEFLEENELGMPGEAD
jgi:hypothetical protein